MMKNDKIGILTFHYAHNYGAVLQTYALRKHLQAKGFKVDIVNYQNVNIASAYNEDVGVASKETLMRKYGITDSNKLRSFPKRIKMRRDFKSAQEHWQIQHGKFRKFIAEYILDGNETVLRNEDLSKLDYGAFVAGSDQIWNQRLTKGIDPVYFLDFPTSAKKVFYGASNGSNQIPEACLDYYKNALTSDMSISSREAELSADIERQCGVKASRVLDPTLLLEGADYEPLISQEAVSDKFVFAYFVTENPRLMEISRYIARALKLPLIELHYHKIREFSGENQRADMGPSEFLYYIKNAEFVITNSFHGTVFSILFKKLFYSVYEKDARKDGLLASLNLSDRKATKSADVDLNATIDYTAADAALDELRRQSFEFLSNALDK